MTLTVALSDCGVAFVDDFFSSAVSPKSNLEAAGAGGQYKWHLMLPSSARVSSVTYAAVVPLDTLSSV